jgi:hypothetical protein
MSNISAGTSTTTSLVQTGDLTGNLVLQSNAVTIATVTSTGVSVTGNVSATISIISTPVTLASLTAVSGARAFVNNSNLVATGNFGNQIAGTGANTVPVWSNGTSWFIG